MEKRHQRPSGFTAIELLIVLSILGIIVVSLAPGLCQSLRDAAQEQDFSEDQIRQKKTIADMRNTGTALFSWLTDEVGAAAAGSDSTIDLRDYPAIRTEDLATILSPAYLQEVPDVDGFRVDLGGCPPRPPTDPYVRDYRIRFFRSRCSLRGFRPHDRFSGWVAGNASEEG